MHKNLGALAMLTALMLSGDASADVIRVYCKPDGVIFEQREDENYTNDNRMFDLPTVVLDRGDVPLGNRDQLRCRDGKVVLDESVKTPAILKAAEVAKLKGLLDQELDKEDPDPVEVVRIHRQMEKVRKGEKLGSW